MTLLLVVFAGLLIVGTPIAIAHDRVGGAGDLAGRHSAHHRRPARLCRAAILPAARHPAFHPRRLSHERDWHQRAAVRLYPGAGRPYPRRAGADGHRRQCLPLRHLRLLARRLRCDHARAGAAARREWLWPGFRRRAHRQLGDARADHPALDPDGALRLAGECLAGRAVHSRHPARDRHGRDDDDRHRSPCPVARLPYLGCLLRRGAVGRVQARLMGAAHAGADHCSAFGSVSSPRRRSPASRPSIPPWSAFSSIER